jgi:hypothetical protein
LSLKQHYEQFGKKLLNKINQYIGDFDKATEWWENFIKFAIETMTNELNGKLQPCRGSNRKNWDCSLFFGIRRLSAQITI